MSILWNCLKLHLHLTQSFIHSRPIFFYPALYSGPSYLPLPFLLLSSSYLTLPTYISRFLPACFILLLTSSCLWRFLPASSYLPVSFLLLMPSYLTFPTQLFLPTFDASTSLFLPSSWPLPTYIFLPAFDSSYPALIYQFGITWPEVNKLDKG